MIEEKAKNLIIGQGRRSNILRVSMERDTGGYKYYKMRICLELVGNHKGGVARFLREEDIKKLRDYLEMVLEHNNEVQERDDAKN